MVISPVDFQAWAQATGSDYPATPAEKAAATPAVIAWKQQLQAQQQSERGANALATPLAIAGGAGLGLAGLALFNHFRRQGDSEPVAAAKAAVGEVQAQATAGVATASPSAGPFRAGAPEHQSVRARSDRYDGPPLRADDALGPVAAVVDQRGGELPRDQGQYKARTDKGFHDPVVAALNSPEKREAYLATIAEAKGTSSREFRDAQNLIASLEITTADGVDPLDFIAGKSNKERYGTTTAAEEAQNDGFLQQSRTKSNTSAQEGYQSRESAPQSTSDPRGASVFYEDSNGKLVPYRGAQALRGTNGELVLRKNGQPLYTGLRSDGSVIANSHLRYLPNNDVDFYQRTGQAPEHPALKLTDILDNAGDKPDLRFADEEDQLTKGLLLSLPSPGSRIEGAQRRWSQRGVARDGVGDNWVFGRMERGGALVPLDLSGFQSELGRGSALAGLRLSQALKVDGGVVAPVDLSWAVTQLAREHNTDPNTVLRAAGLTPELPTAIQTERTPMRAHALGGRGRDALDRVYNSLGMHAGADAWNLEGMVRNGDIRGAANALASTLPALTNINGRFLRGASQDEKLNIVAEGLVAGLQDLHTTLRKHPQMAAQFGIGKGAGGFGIDAYVKSYVRDWVTVRSLQLDPGGQPTYQVPNDAFELIAYDAYKNNRSVLHELDDVIGGSPNGLTAALKLDRLVSAAQSTKEGDPNTNATSFAQTIFSMPDPDLVSTRLVDEAAGDVKLSFGTRRNYDATAGFIDRNPSEALIDQRIDDYGVIPSHNATLQARIKGTDRMTPEGRDRIKAAVEAQDWIQSNIGDLERLKENLNRGIILGDNGPVSHGRGIVITSNDRGAFLAGDTQGLNTSYREEQFNDENTTPLDRSEDIAFEARLNNQIDPEESISTSGVMPHGGRSEAAQTAAQYASQKLYFKNLGPGSRGAMTPGEAYGPRQSLRRYIQDLHQDANVSKILDSYLPSWPQPAVDTKTGVTQWRGIDVPRHPTGASGGKKEWDFIPLNPGKREAYLDSLPPRDFTPEERSAWLDLERRTLHGAQGFQGPYKVVVPQDWRPNLAEINPSLIVTPRSVVTQTGSAATADNHEAALEARTFAGMSEGFRDDSRLGMRDERLLYDAMNNQLGGTGRRGTTFTQQPIAAAPVSLVNTLAAIGATPVPAAAAPPALTDQETLAARAGHMADYMDKLVGGGIRSSADGKQLVFNNQDQMDPYRTPGDAMIRARIKGLRARGVI